MLVAAYLLVAVGTGAKAYQHGVAIRAGAWSFWVALLMAVAWPIFGLLRLGAWIGSFE